MRGHDGDFSALTLDEKVRLCAEVVEEVAGRARDIVNAGMPATYETVLLVREFDRIGVDGIAVITPFFIEVTQDGLERHFTSVADAGATPIYLHDIPARTRNHIEPATARRLAAYLEVGCDAAAFEVYSGPDHLVHWSLQHGAAGCISGLGNVMPDVLARILACFNAGDEAGAAAAQDIYGRFRKELYALGYPPALVKRALYLMDPSVGASRQPALLPDPGQDARLATILRSYGLLG